MSFAWFYIFFSTGRNNFWFPLFTRSIYCTLLLLDCFDFPYGYICICVYSVTLFIIVINLYIGILQFCGVFFSFFPSSFFLFFFLFFIISIPSSFFLFFFLFFIISIFNFLTYYIFLHLFLCLPFLLVFAP